jgi:hypothetical protein
MKLLLVALLSTASAHAATLEIVNHTGHDARLAELFNVCQKYLVTDDKPVLLHEGQSTRFEVPEVMQHFKICGSGFCSSTSMQLMQGDSFQLEMTLDHAGVINGVAHPDQWGGPSNECPAQ